MLYDSVVYPVFLLATLAAYWLVRNPGGRKYVLCAASLLWLAYLNWRGAATFFMLSLLVYAGAQSIFRRQVDGRARTVILAITLALPISYLATFKYLPEYFVPIRQMLESLRADQTLLLPLGISYFTFRFISYVIEARRRALPPHGFEDFLCYVALFSTFPAGPIDRFAQIQPQLAPSTWQSSDLTGGLQRILLGAAKKVLVADFLMRSLQDQFGRLPTDISLASWRAQVGYLWIPFLYLYFDFSGYSDIAVGTSRLFGIRVMENFNWPLTRGNISDFWRSWHMSLSSWCRDYIYFPVFGLTRNPRLGVYASMLVLGYWHGAHPKWLLWGAWHATGLATWQWWQTFKRRYPSLMQVSRTSRTYRLAAIGVTLNFVVIGGVWTSFDSPLQSLLYIYYLFTP
jgi:alginate O-acetyltransferase complex protein AlgI